MFSTYLTEKKSYIQTSSIDYSLQICLFISLGCLNSNRSFDNSSLPCTTIELMLIIYDVMTGPG